MESDLHAWHALNQKNVHENCLYHYLSFLGQLCRFGKIYLTQIIVSYFHLTNFL